MLLALSNMTSESFVAVKDENMTLLHHAAFDRNYEVVRLMSTLPYFRDIIDDASNEVNIQIYQLKSTHSKE